MATTRAIVGRVRTSSVTHLVCYTANRGAGPHLVVPPGAVVEARAANGVNLVDEDDACLLRTRHLEKLTHHPRALSHVLLHQLAPDDAACSNHAAIA